MNIFSILFQNEFYKVTNHFSLLRYMLICQVFKYPSDTVDVSLLWIAKDIKIYSYFTSSLNSSFDGSNLNFIAQWAKKFFRTRHHVLSSQAINLETTPKNSWNRNFKYFILFKNGHFAFNFESIRSIKSFNSANYKWSMQDSISIFHKNDRVKLNGNLHHIGADPC